MIRLENSHFDVALNDGEKENEHKPIEKHHWKVPTHFVETEFDGNGFYR